MLILTGGLALWVGAHLFKRLAPGPRARLGDTGKGLVAAGVVIGMILMIWGYRVAGVVPVYAPFPGAGHLNNLLMLFAFYSFGISHSRGLLAQRVRHPMLISVVIWAVAHLVANGDLASIILFGGLGLWAVGSILLINGAQPGWVPPQKGALRGDLINIAVTLVIYGVVSGIHIWLGRNPFLGTYG